jgi:hypothetical protein
MEGQTNRFRCISEDAARRILGIESPVPLSPRTMAAGLRVTFFPVHAATERVLAFSARLRQALTDCGVRVIDYADAVDERRPGKMKEGIVVIATGDMRTGDLPVDHVSNLRKTTIVGIVDGPCPADAKTSDQEKLNSVVRTLTWSIVQVSIYVDNASWTVCTMNGAIIPCTLRGSIAGDVLSILVPKLAAPVVPPHAADFETQEGVLDLSEERFRPYVDDFTRSGVLWARTGLLLFHTSMDELEFRNPFYKRIAAAYLDHRSGMSYGFLARQLAVPVSPATVLDDGRKRPDNDESRIEVELGGKTYSVEVPDVWMFTTRSGCDKSHIDAHRDILLMGLSRGRVVFKTPKGVDSRVDFKPSYDTLTILAHAVGNALAGSVIARLNPGSRFAMTLQRTGAALAHWHGGIERFTLPEGYVAHGESNPPVSCSTHQAALFALTGKLTAVQMSLDQKIDFAGDVHVEPHHGVNVTGYSLEGLAVWVLENLDGLSGSAIDDQSVPAPRSVVAGR